MTNEMTKKILRNFLVIRVISNYCAVHSETISRNQLSESKYEAHHHPKVTYFTHGTIERQEDNILSQDAHTASVIFLHGLGSTGKKFKEAVLILKPNYSFRHIKIIFPTSPLIPYTPNNGTLSRAWFDKKSSNSFSPEDPESLKNSIQDIRELIQREISLGIPLNKIVIGGFSLGGALALNTGYRSFCKNAETLAGVFALSAYLHANSSLYEELKDKIREKAPPLFYVQGTRDKRVLFEWGNETFQQLRRFGIQGEFFSQKRLVHRISTKGIDKLFEWLERVLPT